MFTLKHLKTAQTCFDLIQIIFRELTCSLLKLLILKFVVLLLLLALQPTVGFSLLSDSPPFRPFLTQLSPPSYS